MAIVQINDPNARGTGHRFGESVGGYLEELVGHKVNQLKRHGAYERNFHALMARGFPEQEATALSQLPDETLRDFFKEGLIRGVKGSSQKPSSPYEQLLSQLQAGGQPTQQQTQPAQQTPYKNTSEMTQLLGGSQQMQQPTGPQQQQPLMPQLFSGTMNAQGQPMGQRVIPQSQGGTGLPSGPMGPHPAVPFGGPQAAAQSVPMGKSIGQQTAQAQSIDPESSDANTRLLGNPMEGMRPAEKAKLAMKAQDALNKKEYQEARLRAKELDQTISMKKFMHDQEKEERPYYEETLKDYKHSKDTLQDVKAVIKLINSGELINPTEDHIQRWLSGALKINLKDLRGATTEQFNKIVKSFVKNAKSWFGARITDRDLKVFMETLPELSMSHEGKMRLLGSMIAAATAQQIRYSAMKDLMDMNGGHLPPYAKLKAEEMASPYLDDLANQFVNGNLTPPLSKAAEESMLRNQWMRTGKAAMSMANYGPSQVGSMLKPLISAAGKVAAFGKLAA